MNQFPLIRKGSFILPFLILIFANSPVIAQLNITGKPGLIYTPSANFNEEGTFLFGGGYKPKKYSFRRNNKYSDNTYFLNLTLLKRLEIGLNLTRSNGVGKISGIGDRQLDVKFLLARESKIMPAVSVIVSAPFSINNSFTTNALVASKSVPLSTDIYADISAGYGSPYYLLRNDSEKSNYNIFHDMKWKMKKDLDYGYLSGFFGGVNLRYKNIGGLLLEWDSQQFNMGAYTVLFKKWTVQAGLLNFDRISFGTSYALNLKNLPHRLKIAEAAPALSELPESREKKILKNFENVTLDTLHNKVYYEQRINRNPLYGMLEMRQAVSGNGIKDYLPMFQGIIMGQYSLDSKIEVKSLNLQERKAQEQKFPLHKKRYLADFWLQPVFAVNFGYRLKPVQSNTSILLQSQFYIWQGLVLNAGILFPITNDLDARAKIIRPAPVFLNQFFAVNKHFFSASAGYFYGDQYGVNMQYRHDDLKSPLSFGLEAGLTGTYYYTHGGMYAGPVDQLLLLADAAYRLSHPDITLKLSGGQYLYKDRGVRFDMMKQFTNVEIGVYIMKTNNGGTGGFNFAIPIPPGKIFQGSKARLRTTDEYRWEYYYSRGFQIGERYRTGYQLDQKLRQYHVQYLNGQRN